MSTLLLRFAGPVQSWGINSKFEVRRTENAPSKSGVTGLLAAALGIRRNEDISSLNKLRLGVRTDPEGRLLKDFHTAHSEKNSYITTRYYLSDAIFLVGLECGDEIFLRKLEYALKHPAFPLFLGRRSCPPEAGMVLGIRDLSLEKALEEEPWQGPEWKKKKMPSKLSMFIECVPDDPTGSMVKDKAESFDPYYRKYGYRRLKRAEIKVASDEVASEKMTSGKNPDIIREHDAMGEL